MLLRSTLEKQVMFLSQLDVYLVLSEIHSSLTSSLRRGRILITSPPLVLTTILEHTASSTSIDSVFLLTEIIRTSHQILIFIEGLLNILIIISIPIKAFDYIYILLITCYLVSHGRAVKA